MIQRVQSVWLFIVCILSVVLIFVSVVNRNYETVFPFDLVFKIENVIIVCLTLITIFLYKNRPLQIKLGYVIIVLLVLSVITMYADMSIALTEVVEQKKNLQTIKNINFMLCPVISIVLTLLAIRAIKKDEKLVRSLDRLR